jgi:hypothetical protein
MQIFINGKPADITLEAEKNVGELLTGIEIWLEGTGNHISGIEIDGERTELEAIPQTFERDLANIQTIDIVISSFLEFASEALIIAKATLKKYENAAFDEKQLVRGSFETCAAARFLADHIPDLAKVMCNTLAGEGLSPIDTIRLIDERLREIEEPKQEIITCGALVSEITVRLEDLPLDMQTGKDKKAMETIRLFSHIAEKLFRLLAWLKYYGFEIAAISIDSIPIKQFIEEFDAVLKELLGAYEAYDTVLVGDISEYEMAPRLLKLYSAMKESIL